MVLPPPLGQGLQLATFEKINRRFSMKRDNFHFAPNYFQVSGIAHWMTPPDYEKALGDMLDDSFFGVPSRPVAGARAALRISFSLNFVVTYVCSGMLGLLILFASAGALPARAPHPGTPIMGLFARLTEAVGGGVCYHNECSQGQTLSASLATAAAEHAETARFADIDVLPVHTDEPGKRPQL